MTHLRKHVGGHLLKDAGGHLSKFCIPCNDCDPNLRVTFYVTLAGLAGDFVAWNGKTEVTWYDSLPFFQRDNCIWSDTGDSGSDLALYYSVDQWIVGLLAGGCAKSWTEDDTTAPCDPTANTYSEATCSDLTCVDGDSCEDSAGATCAVSTS